jgi:hypothetical protein
MKLLLLDWDCILKAGHVMLLIASWCQISSISEENEEENEEEKGTEEEEEVEKEAEFIEIKLMKFILKLDSPESFYFFSAKI